MTLKVEATAHIAREHTEKEGIDFELAVLDLFREFVAKVERIDTRGASACANLIFTGSGVGHQDVRAAIGTFNYKSSPMARED